MIFVQYFDDVKFWYIKCICALLMTFD